MSDNSHLWVIEIIETKWSDGVVRPTQHPLMVKEVRDDDTYLVISPMGGDPFVRKLPGIKPIELNDWQHKVLQLIVYMTRGCHQISYGYIKKAMLQKGEGGGIASTCRALSRKGFTQVVNLITTKRKVF